jgi:hypothetical protein
MNGTITEVSIRTTAGRRPGGLIRPDDGSDRIAFDASELVSLCLKDSLGVEVAFDMIPDATGKRACRVRPVRSRSHRRTA